MVYQVHQATVRFEEDLWRDFKIELIRRGMTAQEFWERAVREFVQQSRAAAPPPSPSPPSSPSPSRRKEGKGSTKALRL